MTFHLDFSHLMEMKQGCLGLFGPGLLDGTGGPGFQVKLVEGLAAFPFKTAENDPCVKMQATRACLPSCCRSKMPTLSHALLVL